MKCPNCQGILKTTSYEGIKIETCPQCSGEWLDADELGHVNRVREVRFSEEERRAIAQSTSITGVPLEDVDRDLACPKCGGQTDAVNFGGDSGIISDRCTGCKGFWLDKDELEKIQSLVEGWDDCLPDDLAKHGEKLHQVAERVDAEDNVNISHFGFVNAMINGVLDLFKY